MKSIYLDHAATTPLDAEVLEYMLPYYGDRYGNPSSLHASGRRSLFAMEEARAAIARTLGALPEEIIFTGSGTESDNLAILGTARAYRARGNHVILSNIEHKAVLEAGHLLEAEGFEVTYAPVDAYGLMDATALASLVRDDTILVSLMLVNNELGTIQPVSGVSSALRERRLRTGLPKLHTDACQAAGHVRLDVETLGVDLMSLNGSKIYGPKGIGILYKQREVKLAPMIVGGGQERGRRAGTESIPQIAGMAAALLKAERMREAEVGRLGALRQYFIAELQNRIPGIMVNGHREMSVPHIVHVTVPNIEGESMLLMLDQAGIEVATGSACSAADLRPSYVLRAIGLQDELIHGSLRFSFGRETTQAQLDEVLRIFPDIVKQLQAASALTTQLYAYTRK